MSVHASEKKKNIESLDDGGVLFSICPKSLGACACVCVHGRGGSLVADTGGRVAVAEVYT